MTATKCVVFFFDLIEVREREFSIVRGGEVIPVEPRAFRVLLYLLRNTQKLVTKEELLNSVWNDAIVTENSLARTIVKLRQGLGDDAREPRYIETVATLGYRFLCPVEVTEDPSVIASPPEPPSLANPSPLSETSTVSTAPQPAPVIRSRRWTWVLAGAAVSALIALALAAYKFVHFRATTPDPARVKMQFDPPQLAEYMSSLGLSPDGRFLNFLTCEAFTCKIWIRPLDSLEAQILRDGSRALVFWSPDSRYLAFQSAGNLYKIEPRGGAPIFLAKAPPRCTGGVWLDSGVIVLTTHDGLYRVPDSGGAPVKFGSQAARNDAWLPGNRFLYSNDKGVFVGSLEGKNPVSILPDDVATTYVPPPRPGLLGHVLFIRDGKLLAQEFDAEELPLHGDPIPIVASENDMAGGYINIAAASRNGVLALRSGNTRRVILTWLDRSGKRLQTLGKPFNLSRNPTIRLSPNDAQAIVDVGEQSLKDIPDARDLWIENFAHDTFSRFTFDGAIGGIWSPDGNNILWADLDYHHYLKAADGSGKSELLYKNPKCYACLVYDWSRDGKLTSFAAFNDEGKANIWFAPLDGDRKPYPFREGSFNDFYGMFSPDHRWLAYTSDESGQNQIYIESIPAGKKRSQVSTEGGNWPIWRRDGKELFYRQGSSIIAVPIHLTDTAVDIGKPQALFTVPPGTRFQVSRDGERFLLALPVEGTPAMEPITIDTDWRAGLKK